MGPGLVCLDCTLGGAGHFGALLERIAPGGSAIGLDRDAQAVRRARGIVEALDIQGVGVHLVHASFSELARVVPGLGFDSVDRVLFDLGLSSDQLDDPKRGFSFLRDGPLDMRQDTGQGLTAEEVVNDYSPVDLLRILREYGEERQAQRIVDAIVAERRLQPITGTRQLADLVTRALAGRTGRSHPATRTFQALRIEVGGEADEVLEGLPQAARLLSLGGRLAVITFHSLEERLVKQALRPFTRHGQRQDWHLIRVGGVLTADRGEVRANPRSRSAKLRVLQKVAAKEYADKSDQGG